MHASDAGGRGEAARLLDQRAPIFTRELIESVVPAENLSLWRIWRGLMAALLYGAKHGARSPLLHLLRDRFHGDGVPICTPVIDSDCG